MSNWNYYYDIGGLSEDEFVSDEYREAVSSITRHIEEFERRHGLRE